MHEVHTTLILSRVFKPDVCRQVKLKVNFTLEKGHEGPEREELYSSTLSLTLARLINATT
jgi:hypothetical protein